MYIRVTLEDEGRTSLSSSSPSPADSPPLGLEAPSDALPGPPSRAASAPHPVTVGSIHDKGDGGDVVGGSGGATAMREASTPANDERRHLLEQAVGGEGEAAPSG